ncbi:hypothetical protein ACFPM7_01080 [Actinokineospora guangxiensis]|uniref:Uncharacterized protein n=1 Tax=Actinokineospora guangxiensis TaxID=1490288 RepID=A0ABW0EHC6_9PSEU
MQPAFDSIQASLAPIAGAAPTPQPPSQIGLVGGTGKFSFSPDEIRAIAKEWRELADEYQLSIKRVEGWQMARPSGSEWVSEHYAAKTCFSGNRYLTSLEEKHKYCLQQAVKFTNSLNRYLGVEQITAEGLMKIDAPASKPGGI